MMETGAGAQLGKMREQRGLSRQDVGQRLKFSLRQLDALEAGRYDELPDLMFVRAMIRTYARLLETDPEPLLQILEQERPDASLRRTGSVVVSVPLQGVASYTEKDPPVKPWVWSVLGLLFMMLMVLWWWLNRGGGVMDQPVSAPVVSGHPPVVPVPPDQPSSASEKLPSTGSSEQQVPGSSRTQEPPTVSRSLMAVPLVPPNPAPAPPVVHVLPTSKKVAVEPHKPAAQSPMHHAPQSVPVPAPTMTVPLVPEPALMPSPAVPDSLPTPASDLPANS